MEIKNISKLNHDLCCGCESCAQKCPKHCISMIEKEDGFLYPQIDNSLCVNCGLCVKACPALSDEVAAKPYKAYALFNKDDDERRESSSGGVFISFAKRMIEEGGVVCGVVFDSRWMPHHVCAETLEDMRPMMGSKYVQSRTDKVYQECEVYLKSGRKVLFTGTPCQCSALHTFLRHKEYPNLLTIDVICHGVPSPGVWKEYLNETFGEQSSCRRQAADGKNTVLNSSLNAKSPIGDIKFRDKTDGWEKFRFVVRPTSASKADQNSVLLSEPLNVNLYMKGFLSDLYLRESCYQCPARPYKSFSDLTIGDFWGVDRLGYSHLNDHKGLSIMVVNTQKGEDSFDECKSDFNCVELSIDEAIKSNSNIITHKRVKKVKLISKYQKYRKTMSLVDAVKKTTHVSFVSRKMMGIKYRWEKLKKIIIKNDK
mgnify:FL=1